MEKINEISILEESKLIFDHVIYYELGSMASNFTECYTAKKKDKKFDYHLEEGGESVDILRYKFIILRKLLEGIYL